MEKIRFCFFSHFPYLQNTVNFDSTCDIANQHEKRSDKFISVGIPRVDVVKPSSGMRVPDRKIRRSSCDCLLRIKLCVIFSSHRGRNTNDILKRTEATTWYVLSNSDKICYDMRVYLYLTLNQLPWNIW